MQDVKTRLVHSDSYNPFFNLALEEHLFTNASDNEVIFYLWQNAHTIVIGRNQNPYKECNLKVFEKDNGKLARRLSGGGAVYHDLGNLNFTFIMPKELFSLKRQFEVIINALEEIGLKAYISGRNDLLIDEKKFSGNAFYHSKKTSLHHGTILVDVNMEKLPTYLNVSKEKLKSKGVKSVRSRVTNLKSFKPDLDINTTKKILEDGFARAYKRGESTEHYDEKLLAKIRELYQRYSSHKWRYGQTPNFTNEFGTRFDWGGVDFNLEVEKNEITKCVIFSDSLEPDIIDLLSIELVGCDFHHDSLSNKIEEMGNKFGPHQIFNSLSSYFKHAEF